MAATFPVMSGGIIWQTALFDNWNPLRCVDHAGQPLHLDGTGNLVTQTDANGNTTRYTYDSLNRLVGQSDGESGDGPLQQCGARDPEDANPRRPQTEAGSVEAGNDRR